MAGREHLPQPELGLRAFGAQAIPLWTDERLYELTGIRVAFSGRAGGVSQGPYASLNLGGHVGDDPQAVADNRRVLLSALGAPDVEVVVPRQVHGTRLVAVDDLARHVVDAAREEAAAGADGVVVAAPGVAALLCFADCVPVVLVAPDGRFAVVHAGWRGMEAGVAAAAARRLGPPLNVYVGPHIHAECFETGPDVRERFVRRFGEQVAPDERRVDLLAALRAQLAEAGVDDARVVDAGVCTRCHPEDYFSYRASGGACGRHGAIAFRKDR